MLSYILFGVDTRMIVFLGATSAALIMNALIAWFAYKAIANMSAQATERMNSFRQSGVREWIRSVETFAGRAAAVTSKAKVEVHNFEPTLIHAEQKLAYALHKMDKSCDIACGAVTKTMNTADKVASRGSWIIDQLFSGARAASAIVRAARER